MSTIPSADQVTIVRLRLLGHTVVVSSEAQFATPQTMVDLQYGSPGGDYEAELQVEHRLGNCVITRDRSQVVAATKNMAEVPDLLVSALNRLALDLDSERLHIHGGVAEVEGRGVILVGESGAGKTTLCSALLGAGHRYLSDEMATVSPSDALVQAYPKPLTFKSGYPPWVARTLSQQADQRDGADGTSLPVAGSELGTVGRHPIAPSIIVFPHFQSGTSCTARPVGDLAACIRIIEQLLDANRFGSAALPVLMNLVGRCSSWDLPHGGAEEAVSWIEDLPPRMTGPRLLLHRFEYTRRNATHCVWALIEGQDAVVIDDDMTRYVMLSGRATSALMRAAQSNSTSLPRTTLLRLKRRGFFGPTSQMAADR